MKQINTLNLLLFILLFSGCQSSDTEIDSFDVVTRITEYDSIYSDRSDPFGQIKNMGIIDGILITEHMSDAYRYSFIDVNEKKQLCRWGIRGNAPNEFIDFGVEFTISGDNLVFLEGAKKEINSILVSDIVKGESPLSVKKESYPYIVDFRPSRLGLVGDKKIWLGSFSNGRFGVLDSNNEIMDIPSDYPFDCGEVDGIYRGSVFQGKLRVNHKQNRFVVSTFASDVFEIYQLSGTDIQRIYVSPFKHAPQVWLKGGRFALDDDKNIAGLMAIAVSEDFICFTYSSKSYHEALNTDRESNEILCFNWEGEKVKKYILPFPITEFCIDKHYIYGVRNNSDGTVIYRFKM